MPKSLHKPGRPIAIARLHPTQLTLGFEELETRLARWRRLTPVERERLMQAKSVPFVRGPGGRAYMIDHHHFCRVLHEAGESEAILGEERLDLSALDLDGFWVEMERLELCWPIDRWGGRRPNRLIPAHVKDLTDNPWRSFARSVRGEAFADEDRPFQEFRWGEYFRAFMTERLVAEHGAMARALAIRLARLEQARGLPGWQGDDD